VLPGEEQALAANVAMQRSCGAAAEVIDAATFAQRAPGIRTDDLTQVAWEPEGGYGDGAVVAGDLLAAARDRGVRYQPNSPVHALQLAGGRVTGVLTDHGPLPAGTVLLAAGVWAPPLLRDARVDLPIETELHHVALLSHPAGGGAPIACIDSTTQTYFRPEAGGRMTLVGSFTAPGARAGRRRDRPRGHRRLRHDPRLPAAAGRGARPARPGAGRRFLRDRLQDLAGGGRGRRGADHRRQ